MKYYHFLNNDSKNFNAYDRLKRERSDVGILESASPTVAW